MFSFVCALPATEACLEIKKAGPDEQIPPPLRDFVLWGINGLRIKYGADVVVMIRVTGHLCADGKSHEISTAQVSVRKAPDKLQRPKKTVAEDGGAGRRGWRYRAKKKEES